MNTSHRYQYGSLTRRKRIRTEDVWQFRYYETCPDGQRRRRSKIIGMLSQYPTPTDMLLILERFRLRLNLQNRLDLPVTLDALADDYVEKEVPLLRYGTQQAHLSSLRRWIRPRWGGCLVCEIKPIEVEQWLRSLPLAEKSKVNLRSLLPPLSKLGFGLNFLNGAAGAGNTVGWEREQGGWCSLVGLRLGQDNASLDVAAVFLELGAQEVQESARQWAARAAV
jgi:hypothetical protein